MSGIKDLTVHLLTGSPFWVTCFLIIVLILAVILYRKTNPPLSKPKKALLFGLRLVAVIALFAALFKPVLSYVRSYDRVKQIDVLVDSSKSMTKEENGLTRSARLDSLLASSSFEQLQENTEVTMSYFGGDISGKESEVDIEQTAIGEALYTVVNDDLSEPVDYIVLLSDGNSNFGRQPDEVAGQLGTPVLAVDLSAESEFLDIGITDVRYSDIMFVGEGSEIKVNYFWQGGKGSQTKLELSLNNRIVATQAVTLDEDVGLGEATMAYRPEEPGQQLLKMTLTPLGEEENQLNNSRTFSVKVLKSKLLTLLVTSRPDYDIGFLKRYLDQADRYETELIITGSQGGNLQGTIPVKQTELNRYDLILFHDPKPSSLNSRREIIESYLKQRGGAIWIIMGEQFASETTPEWLRKLVPFGMTAGRSLQYRSFNGRPSESHLYHPSVRLGESQAEIRQVWSDLPPFEALLVCDYINPLGEQLVYADLPSLSGNENPILGFTRLGPGKLFATAALPFWKWGFTILGYGGETEDYQIFLEGTSSWLTIADDLDPVRINPENTVYNRGDKVQFTGYAYDLGFRPLPGVTGSVSLENSQTGEQFETDLLPVSEGKFEAEFSSLPSGEYTYTGQFTKDGQRLLNTDGRLHIEHFSVEEFDQSGKPEKLRAIALSSGGIYTSYNDFDQAATNLDVSPITETIDRELPLWNKFWLLLIIIGAISVEWLMRKLNQLL